MFSRDFFFFFGGGRWLGVISLSKKALCEKGHFSRAFSVFKIKPFFGFFEQLSVDTLFTL